MLFRSTAFAEVAYYRMVFLEGTRADLGLVTTQLTVFRVNASSKRGVDLTRAPFDKHRRTIASPSKYSETQALGRAMRDAGVELFRYPSARDPKRGANVAAFTAGVFGRSQPRDRETWHCLASKQSVELANAFAPESFVFARSAFLVDGSLPAPAL